MIITAFASLKNFSYENIGVHINGFTIGKDEKFINDLLDKEMFKVQLGSMTINEIKKDYVIYCTKDVQDLSLDNKEELFYILASLNSGLIELISNLWLIKDNACYIGDTYFFIKEIESFTKLGNSFKVSNAIGTSNNTSFSKAELSLLRGKTSKMREFLNSTTKHPITVDPITQRYTLEGHSNHLPHDYNKIERAILFQDNARSTTEMIVKITFLIGGLESLFTSTSSEVTHQVSERVALYIGTDAETRRYVYNTIKEAYSVRSSYMHGNKVKHDREKRITLITNLDEIFRKIIWKAVNDKDLFIFNEKNDNEKNKFDDHFRDLIFK